MICQHFGACGGCQLQDIPYAEQLARKRAALITLLGAFVPPDLIAPVRGMADGQPWRFRNKAAFVFGRGPDGRSLVMGHYARGSQSIVPIVECPVHADRANQLAFDLRDRLAAARVSAAGPDLSGVLRHIIVRTTYGDREAVVLLVVTRNDRSLRRPVQAFVAGPHAPTGFFLNIHDRPGPFMVGRETIRLAGRGHVRESRTGTSFLVSPTAFFQTNVEGARLLVEEVLQAAASVPRGQVLDLYAGSGLFALPLAARGWQVTAVEENPQAVRDAEANAKLNEIPPSRLRLLAARVEHAIAKLSSANLVVFDPPRQGCSPRAIDEVFARIAPQRAIYVSCNPSSFAAELPAIVRHGYRISRVLPVDMFPHTDHIELVATIDRNTSGGRHGASIRAVP